MGKYLKKFETEADYQAFKDSDEWIIPNVSAIYDAGEVFYKSHFVRPVEPEIPEEPEEPEVIIEPIVYAKYNATSENMLAFWATKNIAALTIDGEEIELTTPEKNIHHVDFVADNITVIDIETGETTCPSEYLSPNINFNEVTSWTFYPTNSAITANDYNALLIIDREDGITVSQIAPIAVLSEYGFYVNTSNNVGFFPTSILDLGGEVSGATAWCFCNWNPETSELNIIDTTHEFTTVTSNDLEKQYMFETEGEHVVEVTLCDGMDIGGLFYSTCVTEVTIPGTVQITGYSSFTASSSLTSITLNEGVKNIGMYSLHSCSNLTTINLPNTLKGIDAFACAETGVTELIIPDSVEAIGMYGCSGNMQLTNLHLGTGLKTIGQIAFGACENITEITIPENVTSIGHSAFYNCSALQSVYCYPTTPPSAFGDYSGDSWDAFDSNAAGRLIYVPAESLNAYKSADGWSEYADYIVAM